jgi:GTP cyclohydrolase I
MVIERDIYFHSLCAHHLLPFMGKVHIAYIPRKQIAGLSKLARTVAYFSHRPQVQEDLTSQIAEYLCRKLRTRHVAVIVQAEHLCMSMRGAKSPGHQTTTAALRGGFKRDGKTRAELYALLGMER